MTLPLHKPKALGLFKSSKRSDRFAKCLLLMATLTVPSFAAYTVNSDGTVYDDSTRLVWDRCLYPAQGTQCATGTPTEMNWHRALSGPTTANANRHLGYSDWRLPNVKELESLVKLSESTPTIDLAAFSSPPGRHLLWSSTANARPSPAENLAWTVLFDSGYVLPMQTLSSGHVRLVRSGQPLAAVDRRATVSVNKALASSAGIVTPSLTSVNGAAVPSGCGLASAEVVLPVSSPAGVGQMPYGLLRFVTTACGLGATLRFTVAYPQTLPSGSRYYKWGKKLANQNDHWYEIPANFNGNQVSFSITDGGLGDDDLTVNGVIADDGGPGVPLGAFAPAELASVPTLTEWALCLLISLMLYMASIRLRQPITRRQ